MPVTNLHPEYSARFEQWKQARDFYEGQRAVHAAGEKYLPKLVEEPDTSYKARLCRTSFFNATQRTIEGLVGMLFRSAPESEVSPGTLEMLLDVTKSGESADAFAAKCADELETVGKVAILVDHPPAPVDAEGKPVQLSVAQVQQMNVRPHLARYTAESLINWQFGWVNNKTALVMAVLAEKVSEDNPADPFAPACVEQWRELRLVNGIYMQQLWRRPAGGGDPVPQGAPTVPHIAGKPLAEIPLHIIGDGRPPLQALMDVNLSHYQTTADLEHGAHMTALPQPWVSGVDSKNDESGNAIDEPMYIGGGTLWKFPMGATAGMLEYTGQGLQALSDRLKVKEQQMAVLGARMLEAQKSGVEAADTAGMHRAGEQSILQRQAGELSAKMEAALAVFDLWAGGTGKVKYQINKDFLPTALSAQEITALVGAWQSGAISHEELFGKFQRGGVVSEGATFEDEQTKIANAPPALVAPTPAAAGAGAGEE
jgi:hypothetical protein